jgi:predicted phage terminase large subunit-like protein
MSIEEKRLKVIKQRCETDLLFFTRYIFKEHFGTPFLVNHHHKAIVDWLGRVERREASNLVINIPPRHTKTEMMVMWMAQTFAREPKAQFINVSYSDELAMLSSARVREIINGDAFQRLWPIKIKADSDSKKLWHTTEGGGIRANAAGGPITGFGAGRMTWRDGDPFDGAIIADDPLKPDDAQGAERENVNARFNGTLKSRRNHRLVPMVIVMQRLHETDPSGFALSGNIGLPFEHLKLKGLQDDGTPLWPHLHSAEELEAMRLVDRMTFAAQYQQEPSPSEGGIFRLAWFRRYINIPPAWQMRVHSWDTGIKAKESNDPTCCTVWRVTENGYFLEDVLCKRMEYPDLKRAVAEMAERDRPDAILIEDKASGQELLQELKRHTTLPCIPIEPEGDKETRARVAAALVEAGRVWLPEQAHWLADYEREMGLFPNSEKKDRVDSTSQFLRWVRDRGSSVEAKDKFKKFYGM